MKEISINQLDPLTIDWIIKRLRQKRIISLIDSDSELAFFIDEFTEDLEAIEDIIIDNLIEMSGIGGHKHDDLFRD